MRRSRRHIAVWPAFADLMTILAVVGLFLALGLMVYLPETAGSTDLLQELRQQHEQRRELEATLAEEREAKEDLRRQLREAAKNEEMFQAIQRAQDLVDEISTDASLEFGADQTLQFGDDLVSFALNSVEPVWQAEGRERLRQFCRMLSQRLSQRGPDGRPLRELFLVQVEGHTDSSQCPGDPNCNWWISAGRAASFVAVMRDEEFCPGGRELELRPIGFAATRPLVGEGAVRRITVGVKPNYKNILG